MSEKRFERWNDHSCKVKDNQEDTFLNWEDVVNKLNEQQTEIDNLKEENGQLRQFINKGRRLSVKELVDNANENELLKKKIRGFEKENGQLRKELYECEKDYLIETSDEVDRALYVDDELKELAKKYGVEDD